VAEQQRKDRILVIDRDPDESSVLAEAALEPYGFEVLAAEEGGSGLQMAIDQRPDLVILDLHIQGLSGQDLLAALNAQGLNTPVVVLTDRGKEAEALAAFRLGARDYIVRPFREPEVIQVVERALREVRLQRERETLLEEVHRAADESSRHLRELRTLMSVGKSVSALGQPSEVFDRALRAAIQLTQAESAGLFLRDPDSNQLILRAGHNLSRNLVELMGQPVTDTLAKLVMDSRETFIGGGSTSMQNFRPAQEDASAVIYAPLVFQDKAIGVLWVGNSRGEFEAHLKDIMTVLADYAAISVANARLFAAMEKRSQELQHENAALRAAGGDGGCCRAG
jgi:CheY-like chemotaxis protein